MATDTLTPKQAEVMPLVYQGYNSKEIGRMLGISPTTVDQRVDGARRRLGATTRAEAARLFAAENKIPERVVYEPFPVPLPGEDEPSVRLPRDDLRFHDAMFDERAAWDRGSLWHLPAIEPRDLGKAGRLLAIFALALLMLLGAGEAIDLFREIGGWFSR